MGLFQSKYSESVSDSISTDFKSDFLQKENTKYGVLSDVDIMNEYKNGKIVIEPFVNQNLGNCSYDVTLGEYYYRPSNVLPIINAENKNDVVDYWGDFHRAREPTKTESQVYKLKENQKFILIRPLETILAHTNEYIGGTGNITTMMKTRSTLGRIGICCCKAAGWGDCGYINRYTMEITNFSKSTICLPVGMRVAQIVFFYTNSNPSFSYEKNGHYQQYSNKHDLFKNWSPQNMLPHGPNNDFDEITPPEKVLELIEKTYNS